MKRGLYSLHPCQLPFVSKLRSFSLLLARSYGRHDDGIPESEHASAPIWSGKCYVGYAHPSHPWLSGPALACRICTGKKKMQSLLQSALWFEISTKQIRKKNLNPSKMCMRFTCQALQRDVHNRAIWREQSFCPCWLWGAKSRATDSSQSAHTGTQPGTKHRIKQHFWLTLADLMQLDALQPEIFGRRFGLTHLDGVTIEMKEKVQRDLLSWQGVQTGQSWVLSSYLQHVKAFLLCSWQEVRLVERGK